jgi:hypothetical protein
VQTAGDLVRAVLLLELAAGVELGEHDLDGGFAVEVGVLVLHGVDRDAAPVVVTGTSRRPGW